jgi:hypothetical protein
LYFDDNAFQDNAFDDCDLDNNCITQPPAKTGGCEMSKGFLKTTFIHASISDDMCFDLVRG